MPREFDAVMGRGPHECDCGAEGVAAPLEPSRQDFEQFLRDTAGVYYPHYRLVDGFVHPDPESGLLWECWKTAAAAVSKNLTDKYAEMEAKWMRELLTVSNEIGEARDRILDLLNHDGGPGSIDYNAAKVFRARAKLLEFREITALR